MSIKALFLLCLPSIMAGVMEPLASVVDTAIVGHLSKSELAALAIGVTITNSFSWFFNFLVHAGAQSMASASSGTSKKGESIAVLKVTTFLSVGLGLIFLLLLYGMRHFIYDLAGASSTEFALVDEYFLARVFALPLSLLFPAYISLIRGKGDFHTSFVFLFISTSLNVVLTYYFIFHLNLSLFGAALGTVISQALGACLCLGKIINVEGGVVHFVQLIKSFKLKLQDVKIFGEKGVNLIIRSSCLTLSFFLATRLCAMEGESIIGTHQILLQFWLFSSFFIDGIAVSVNVLSAKYIKEKRDSDLALLKKNGILISLGFGTLFTLVYFVFKGPLVSIFTDKIELINLIGKYWWLIFSFQMIGALAFCIDGFLFGMSEFKYIRNMMLVSVLCVFVPVTIFFPGDDILLNVWLALNALNLSRVLIGGFKVFYYNIPKNNKEYA